MTFEEKINDYELMIDYIVSKDLNNDVRFLNYLNQHDNEIKAKLLKFSTGREIVFLVIEYRNSFLTKKGIELVTNKTKMQEFIQKLRDLEPKMKKPAGIKAFFKFLESLKLEKKFAFQEYNNHITGVLYYSLKLDKWIVFDVDILQYIEKQVPKGRELHLQFNDRLFNQNINDIFNFIENAKIERLSEDDKDFFEKDTDTIVAKYNNTVMQLRDYHDNLFSYLVMVFFNQYNDCLSKQKIRVRLFY